MPAQVQSQEAMYDQRLFNQRKVILTMYYSISTYSESDLRRDLTRVSLWRTTSIMSMTGLGGRVKRRRQLSIGQARTWKRIYPVTILNN